MKDFDDIKRDISDFVVEDPTKESKYGKFLDALAREHDLRGKDKRWDLWYFSQNTEFCRDSAEYFLGEIQRQCQEHEKWFGRYEDTEFRVDTLRRLFGCFCFYLYAASDSFAHEINIFYDIGLKRDKVFIRTIAEEVKNRRATCLLSNLLQTVLLNPDFKIFIDYRNAIMHGYVYPLRSEKEGIFIKEKPKVEMFSFENMNVKLLDFCCISFQIICDMICKGWRCFEIDELTDPHLEEDVREK